MKNFLALSLVFVLGFLSGFLFGEDRVIGWTEEMRIDSRNIEQDCENDNCTEFEHPVVRTKI